jgi:FlaA1/EpsC-like NDP-sugar epimerase
VSSPVSYFKTLYDGDNSLKLLDQSYLPRWIVILLDTILCVFALILVYFILLGTPINFLNGISLTFQGFIFLSITLIYFIVFKTYSGIIRHSTFIDILKLIISSFSTAITLLLINVLYNSFYNEKLFLTTSILLYILMSFIFLLLFRIAVKESYHFLKNTATDSFAKDVVIIGVDDNSISLGKALTTESNLPFRLAGFISNTKEDPNFKILGRQVYSWGNNLTETLSKFQIDGVLLNSSSFKGNEKSKIVEDCLNNNLEVFNVPLVETWSKKEDINTIIKPLEIEDLLGREAIKINSSLIKNDLEGKTILVTGGAGSIGQEIVVQITEFNPKLIVVLDQSESVLYDQEQFLLRNYPKLNFYTELADINNINSLQRIFSKYSFDIIYHAAAYKHVPLMEKNPYEAINVNVLGTKNIADLSVKNKVGKFVLISTDKAVNPTNIMGASKRVAEIYVHSLQNEINVKTQFITTRFGNVLGSNGSVIPFFRKQISQGGPVTVTHKDIIRYFMMIPEACQLVLQAGTMGKGGEIYIFDMGEPVKILDLAEKMIRLSGLIPYEDIDIQITGLRPGEKLYEELLNDSSKTKPTYHPKIMIVTLPTENYKDISIQLNELEKNYEINDTIELVRVLKDIVPEYKSENSEFEKLDID